ncbi:MAG: hypothetical protein IKW06_04575 [Clostridia bacterium]|nr:hypothetical protein [Clostridia bacterium]
MEKKPKKKWIILGIVLAILLLLAVVGYCLVNIAFSIFTDSFYDAVAPSEMPKVVTEILTPEEETPDMPADEKTDTAPETSGQKNKTGGGVLLSAKTIKELEKKVAFSDKMAVLNILSTGLSGADYRALIGMLNNGVTSGEVSKAYQIIKENLSRPDKDKIMDYYYKYSHLIQ